MTGTKDRRKDIGIKCLYTLVSAIVFLGASYGIVKADKVNERVSSIDKTIGQQEIQISTLSSFVKKQDSLNSKFLEKLNSIDKSLGILASKNERIGDRNAI